MVWAPLCRSSAACWWRRHPPPAAQGTHGRRAGDAAASQALVWAQCYILWMTEECPVQWQHAGPYATLMPGRGHIHAYNQSPEQRLDLVRSQAAFEAPRGERQLRHGQLPLSPGRLKRRPAAQCPPRAAQ